MKSREYLRSIFTCLLLVSLLVPGGCGKKEEGANGKSGSDATAASTSPLPNPPAIAECEPGKPGGRLVIASFGDPKTFNPITANETSSTDIIDLVFGGLTRLDTPTQKVLPGLAESWQVGADNRTWTFKLRQGVRWSDGTPFTADDVLFTWEVIYHPEINNVTRDLYLIQGKKFEVTKLDDHMVRFVTPEVYAPFLEFAGTQPLLPRHKLQSAVKEKRFESSYGINAKPSDIVGCGPFRIKAYKPGEHTLLERNPHYWVVDKKGQRLPYLDAMVHLVVPDQNAISLRFSKGETDLVEFVRPEEAGRYRTEAAKGKYTLLDLGLGSERDVVIFNQNMGKNEKTGKPYVDPKKLKWFRNTKFRQALSHAIDRESIVKSTLSGNGETTHGFLTPENKKWNNTKVKQYDYNPAKARQLLKEIGIEDRNGDGFLEDSDGNKIEFVMNTNAGNSRRERGSVIIQDDWKKLGINLIYQPLDFNTLVSRFHESFDFECIFLGYASTSPDPTSSINIMKSDGFSHDWYPRQKSPSTEWEKRIDELMSLQLATLEYEERKKYFDEVQAILSEEVPMIFTASMRAFSAVRNRVKNVRPTVLESNRVTWNTEELWLAE